MIDSTVYIDEAGDLGANRGTQWFILSAVIVDKAAEPAIRATMDKIKTKLNIKHIHLREINDFYRKAYISKELSTQEFTYMNVVFDTKKYDMSKIPSCLITYNFICKYLLQRVSWFLRDTERKGNIVLSSRGTSRDSELINYIVEKLLPYKPNRIENSVFGEVVAKSASSWDMLQLADVCATTTFNAHEENWLGFASPCFALPLTPHLYRVHNKVTNYGIKYFTSSMQPSPESLKQKRICYIKRGEIPSATAT